jgi:orotate phosphoribosyltransferase-like protein
MSGIEVVGIVLGALPIMMNGIEKYSDGLSAAKRLLHPRKELRNMHRTIRTELQVFRNTAVILLHRIATEAQVRALVQKPTSILWKKPGFETQMQDMLGSSYFIWCEVMADISNAIKEIGVELGLPCDEVR